MKTTITNEIKIENPNERIIDYCTNHLVMDNPHYNQNKAMGFSTYGIEKKLYLYHIENDALHLPFGLIKDIYPIIKEGEIDYQIKPVESKKLMSLVVLREYQKNAVEGLINAKNGVLVAPCGVGKTIIGLSLISKLQQKTLWLTHTRELLKQSKDRAKEMFFNLESDDLGEISEGKVKIGNVITFATVQTLSKIDLTTLQNEFGCIVCDECQRVVGTEHSATMFYKVVNSLSSRYKYGLTATPKRKGGYEKTMYALLGDKAFEIKDNEVSGNKIRAKLKYVFTSVEDTPYVYKPLAKKEKENGKEIGKIDTLKLTTYLSRHTHRNDLIIKEILSQYQNHRKQLVMSDRVEHCEKLYEILKDVEGMKIALFIGKGKDNSYIRNHYNDYDVIITTYAMSKEGLDMPALDCLHLTTPKSDNQMLKQCIGRVERAYINKLDALVIAYRDINIRYCNKCCDSVRQALGIRGKGYEFKK